MAKRGIIPTDKASVKLIEGQLLKAKNRQQLDRFYTVKRGNRIIDRFKAFCDWLWLHRESILEILGIVIMFADDGQPIGVQLKEDVEKEKAERVTETPNGEKVEDFLELDEEDKDEDEWFDIADEWEDDDEDPLDEMTRISQETGQYDLGINPLVSDEVQPQRPDQESTD